MQSTFSGKAPGQRACSQTPHCRPSSFPALSPCWVLLGASSVLLAQAAQWSSTGSHPCQATSQRQLPWGTQVAPSPQGQSCWGKPAPHSLKSLLSGLSGQAGDSGAPAASLAHLPPWLYPLLGSSEGLAGALGLPLHPWRLLWLPNSTGLVRYLKEKPQVGAQQLSGRPRPRSEAQSK